MELVLVYHTLPIPIPSRNAGVGLIRIHRGTVSNFKLVRQVDMSGWAVSTTLIFSYWLFSDEAAAPDALLHP